MRRIGEHDGDEPSPNASVSGSLRVNVGFPETRQAYLRSGRALGQSQGGAVCSEAYRSVYAGQTPRVPYGMSY